VPLNAQWLGACRHEIRYLSASVESMAARRFEGLRMGSNASPALGCWVTKFHKPARSATPHGPGLARCELIVLHEHTSVDPPYTRPIHAGHEVSRGQKPLDGAPVAPPSSQTQRQSRQIRSPQRFWEERTHGGNPYAGPWFFMARWDMASAPVCTALFTILGGP
jgi:hypothetical protein